MHCTTTFLLLKVLHVVTMQIKVKIQRLFPPSVVIFANKNQLSRSELLSVSSDTQNGPQPHL